MLQRQFNAKINKLYHEFLKNVVRLISETNFQINDEQKMPKFVINEAQDYIMDLATQTDIRGSLLDIVANGDSYFKKSVKNYQKTIQTWSKELSDLFNNVGLRQFVISDFPEKQYRFFTEHGDNKILYRFVIGSDELAKVEHFLEFDTIDEELQNELGAFIPYSKLSNLRYVYYIDNYEQFKFLTSSIEKVL